MTSPANPRRRIEWIDLARGLALVAMATYHFSWDLEYFGYLDPGTAGTGPLKWYARAIASSFLVLVGVSLVLAHGNGIRWRGFGKRLAMVAGAAAAITAVTWYATPDAYIFFGILHEIAVASLLGLLFLRLPAWLVLAVAAAWFSVPFWGKSELFSQPALLWTGLSSVPPRSNDFVPLFPWFAAVLVGMAAGRFMTASGLAERLAGNPPARNAATRGLRFAGRHSLVTYLVHQPVLIACVWLFSQVHPAPPPGPDRFVSSCVRACTAHNAEEVCIAFCGCAMNRLVEDGLFDGVIAGKITQENDPRVAGISRQCSIEAGIDGN
ncbi:MAG: DUF1624 domain-containing protein [Oricola sp.]